MQTSDYKDFGPVELALDEAFRRWVTKPDAENEAFWRTFQHTYPAKKQEMEEARRLIESLHISPERVDPRQLKSILERILAHAEEQPETGEGGMSIPPRRGYRRIWAAAAAAAVLITMSWAWLMRPPPETVIQNAFGVVKKIVLADSSIVILDAHSEIHFQKGKRFLENRSVLLKGEAYFEVRHDPAHPFTVRTIAGRVEDIGTSFVVRGGGNAGIMLVALVSGRIAFAPGGAEGGNREREERLIMRPGEVYTYNTSNRELKRLPVAAADLTGWTRNELVFKNERLREVLAEMERRYGYHFVVRDSTLFSHRFTGVTPLDQPELVIQKIKDLYDLKVMIKGDSIFLARSER